MTTHSSVFAWGILDRGAWCSDICGATQSRTRLKQLSSRSSSSSMCQILSQMQKIQTKKQADKLIITQTRWCEENCPSVLPCGHEPAFWGRGVPPSWPASQDPGLFQYMLPHPTFSPKNSLPLPWEQEGKGLICKPFREVRENTHIPSCFTKIGRT